MMDYCARESTLNRDDEVTRDQTIKSSIQETRKILLEMHSVLIAFASIVNGDQKHNEEKIQRDASSLWEESMLLAALAYENLQKLNEIKMSII